MPKQLKRRTWSGVVLEQEVFWVADSTTRLDLAEPRPDPPPRTDEEKAEYNEKQSRKRFIRIVNNNFGPDAYYDTKTFDDEFYVDDFDWVKDVLNKYIRRLQKQNPKLKLVAVMGRGKRTGRIHVHMIISGVKRRHISNLWTWGRIKNIEHLREHNYYNRLDHGADYTALAVYLHDHWTPEQGKGKRWRQTMTIDPVNKKPNKEDATVCKRKYSPDKPPATPKGYMLVEARKKNEYGCLYFKYVRIPPKPTGTVRKKRC
jgi:hypothetical protein